jgi:hypothetical protein
LAFHNKKKKLEENERKKRNFSILYFCVVCDAKNVAFLTPNKFASLIIHNLAAPNSAQNNNNLLKKWQEKKSHLLTSLCFLRLFIRKICVKKKN